MNNLSVIIVTNGSPKYILETIHSVQSMSDDIVVVDIGVDEKIIENIRNEKNVQIKKIHEPVLYVEKIREKSKEYASHDYILFLDHDEVIPELLAKEISKKYQNFNYLTTPRKNIIMGKWIEHARWWPDYQTRVFKKDAAIWPDTLHAQPILTGKGHTFPDEEKYAIIHHNYENLDEYLSKMVRYAKADAAQRESYTLQNSLKDGISEFVSRYFAAKGYKDGMHGLVMSFLQMMYYFLVYSYYWENNKYVDTNSNSPKSESIAEYARSFLYEVNYWINKEKLEDKFSHISSKIVNILLRRNHS